MSARYYDSYPLLQPTNSWFVSGKAFKHSPIWIMMRYSTQKPTTTEKPMASISTEKIDQTLRDVIAKEYDNMKGIQKIGRYNGLCPYTPYEDLPVTSKALSEELKKLKPVSSFIQLSASVSPNGLLLQ